MIIIKISFVDQFFFACRKAWLPIIFLFNGVFSDANIIQGQSTGFTKINLEDAVNIALTNHPVIKNQRIKISIASLDAESLPDLGETEIFFGHGQLYSVDKGSYVEIVQNFGSLFHIGLKNQEHGLKRDLADQQLGILHNQLTVDVKRAYNYWIYTHHKLNLLEELKKVYDDFLQIVHLYFEQGSYDLLDKVKAESEFAYLRNSYLEAQDDVVLAEIELQKHLFIEGDLIPESEELGLYEIVKDTSSGIADEIEYLHNEAKLTRLDVKLKKSEAYPDFFAGYFHQKVGTSSGLQGVKIGLALPLWYFPVKKNIEQARLQQEIFVNNHALKKFRSEKEKEALVVEMNQLFKQLQYYKEHVLKQGDLLIQTSQVRFEKEDIDYVDHLGNIKAGIQFHLEYINIVKRYNEKAIELEYYTY